MSPDPYQVLGVARDASTEVLKAAYRRLVRDHHPDVASDKTAATSRTAIINQAWQLIGDPQKRQVFDARHHLESLEREARQRDSRQREAKQREAKQRQSQPRDSRAAPSSMAGQSVSMPRPAAVPNRRAAPESAMNAAAGTAASEAFSSERARLEAQRRARLEREKIERERARRLRGAGTKAESKGVGKNGTSRPFAATAKAATAKAAASDGMGNPSESRPNIIADRATERGAEHGAATREVRLRRKIMLAAQLFHRERKVDEAVALCRAVLHADGRSVAARELLGDIYLQQGRAEYALMMFDQALLIEPDHRMLRRKRDLLQTVQDNRRIGQAKPETHLAKTPRSGLLNRLKARLTNKK